MAGKLQQWIHDKLTDDKGIFQGGTSGRPFGRLRDSNMIARNANKVHDNSNFFLYDEDPEMYDSAGEAGVRFKSKPGWFSDRPHTFGNTVYVSKTQGMDDYNTVNERHGYNYDNTSEYLLHEEVPHIAQWRNEGLLGFANDYLEQLSLYGQPEMYNVGNSMEGFHSRNDYMKEKLFTSVMEPKEGVDYLGNSSSSYSSIYNNPYGLDNYNDLYYHQGLYNTDAASPEDDWWSEKR